MDYEVENTVRTSSASPHPSLYPWFIEEIGPDGKKIGPDYKPWGYGLHFDAKNLRVYRALTLAGDKSPVSSDGIIGALIPSERGRDAPKYSFFGTNRRVETFTLRISKCADDESESCSIWGSVAYVSEWDFENVRQPDAVEVNLALSPSRFKDLAEFVEDGRARGGVTLRLVQGVYAEWSPSIRTDKIKLLANVDDQKLQIEPGADYTPTVLGVIGQFDYRFHRGGSAEDENEPERKSDEGDNPLSPPPAPASTGPDYAHSLALLQAKIARLYIPVWITAIGAVISIFVHR